MNNDSLFQTIMVISGMPGTEADGASQLHHAMHPTTTPLTREWLAWVAENVLRGMTVESMIDAMVRGGVDLVTATREIRAAQSHPYLEAAAKVRAAAGPVPGITPAIAPGITPATLAKRDWVLEIARRSARFDPQTAQVPVMHRPRRDQFLEAFYATNRPVIITGAMDDWRAMTAWTMDNLKQRLADKTIEVQTGRDPMAPEDSNAARGATDMPFGEYIDRVLTAGRAGDFHLTTSHSPRNREALADLWNDFVPFPEYLTRDDPTHCGSFWFGPAGIVTPLHHDLTNNFMAQVVGRKHIKLIAPCELPYVYNHFHCYSQVDLNNVDYARFPLFRNVRIIDVVLNPGELLFLPVGWWHHVSGLDISITMTFTNFVFGNDFHSFYTTYNDL